MKWAVILPEERDAAPTWAYKLSWAYKLLEVRAGVKGKDEGKRFLVGLPGENKSIYLYADEMKMFTDYEKARRYLVALKVMG